MISREPGFLVPRMILVPPQPSPTLSSQQVISLSRSSCVSPIELTEGPDGEGGEWWWSSQIIRRRESLVLHTSFNTLWVESVGKNIYIIKLQAVRIGGNFAPLATSKRAKMLNIISRLDSNVQYR
jgi:hypothetical protein